MGKNAFWKSVLRRTGSLLLLLALLAAASFGFVLRAVEYLTVNGEIRRISENYRPIGTLSSDSGDLTEAAELLEENSYVEFVDRNRYCPAILTDIYNADLDGWTSNREDGLEYGVRTNDILAWAEVEDIKDTLETGVFRYDFRVRELVSGYPDYGDPKNIITVYFDSATLQQENPVMKTGKTYLIRGYYDPYKNTGRGDVLNFDLLPLEEGVLFLEGEPESPAAQRYLDSDTELQERNRHAMMAVTTADMSALPLVQESSRDFYLEDGRWPDREDSVNRNMVCAVTKEFADVRDLKVGDTLTMTLQNRNPSYFGYVTDADIQEACEETEVSLEIVGVYGRLYGGVINDPGFVEFSHNSTIVYIPDGCLPENYVAKEEISASSFSFALISPKGKAAFMRETGSRLEDLGITCTFVENNWETYYASAHSIEQGALYNFVIFALVMVSALAVVSFLYTWQRRKEIAIARSLGVPARSAAVGACLPMISFGACAVLVGGVFAWRYGLKQAEQTLAQIASGGRAELNVFWLVGICLLLWLALSVVLLAGSLSYVHRPVLEILQGKAVRAGGRKRVEEELAGAHSGRILEGDQELPQTFVREGGSVPRQIYGKGLTSVLPAMARFLWHHIRRFSMRSVCALLAAAVFVTASGWLRLSIRSSEKKLDKLYGSVTVGAEIVKKNGGIVMTSNSGAFINRKTVQNMLDTGFVEHAYLEAGAECRVGKMNGNTGMKKTSIFGLAEMEQFLAQDWNREVQIQYCEGYGAELFRRDCTLADGAFKEEPAVIVSEAVWEKWGMRQGSAVRIASSNGKVQVIFPVAGYYTGQPSGLMEDVMFVPLSFLESLEEDDLKYITARFTLDQAKNRELADFRDTAKSIVEASGAGELDLSLVLWDNELRQVVEPMEKNISLMKLLYPVANIVSFFIAGGLAVLLLFQRRREAAVLRVLGVRKMPVRVTLALELLILNVVGVLLGLAIIYVITETVSLPAMGIAAAAYFIGGVIGAVAGSIMVTNARPLELLQVKE